MTQQTDVDVMVVRAGELTSNTAQTPGLPRQVAISPETGSKRIWAGRVTGEPHMNSGPHHHGEAETIGFLLSGSVTILYGENFEKSVDLMPGDFVYVAPFVRHIEQNRTDEPAEFITIRVPDNIVVPVFD